MVKPKVKKRHILLACVLVWLILPEQPVIPVSGASPRDWNKETFWFSPWGRSGVHKGIDIFANKGVPVVAPTYGIIISCGETPAGGKVVAMLGPKWRIHYFAHLDSYEVFPGEPMWKRKSIGRVGNTGNAQGKPFHLHYTVISLIPYPWLADTSQQGWKKMFFLDPNKVLKISDL